LLFVVKNEERNPDAAGTGLIWDLNQKEKTGKTRGIRQTLQHTMLNGFGIVVWLLITVATTATVETATAETGKPAEVTLKEALRDPSLDAAFTQFKNDAKKDFASLGFPSLEELQEARLGRATQIMGAHSLEECRLWTHQNHGNASQNPDKKTYLFPVVGPSGKVVSRFMAGYKAEKGWEGFALGAGGLSSTLQQLADFEKNLPEDINLVLFRVLNQGRKSQIAPPQSLYLSLHPWPAPNLTPVEQLPNRCGPNTIEEGNDHETKRKP
jgi:hypothetical protein